MRGQIAGDSGLDIVTFEVTDGEFEEIAARCFDWPADKWPPPPPDKDRGVVFTGYAGVDRRIVNLKAIEFGQTSNSLVLTSCGPDELEVQVRRADLRPLVGEAVPSVTKTLGGFSGAPQESPHF
jgi:hypothetical protein